MTVVQESYSDLSLTRPWPLLSMQEQHTFSLVYIGFISLFNDLNLLRKNAPCRKKPGELRQERFSRSSCFYAGRFTSWSVGMEPRR